MMSEILVWVGLFLVCGVGITALTAMGALYVGALRETIWGNRDGFAVGISAIGTMFLGLILIALGEALR